MISLSLAFVFNIYFIFTRYIKPGVQLLGGACSALFFENQKKCHDFGKTTTSTTTKKIYFSNKIQVYEYILSATILTEDNIKNNTHY